MQRLIMKCVLARTQTGEISSSFNSSECQAEAIFTVTHIFSHVKLLHTQEMAGNRWWGSLLVLSGSTGWGVGGMLVGY